MKADILTLKALFQKDVRYVIPTFQRPYVWNQEDQWEPLWNDVRNIAEEYLQQLEELGEYKQPLAEQRAGSHFMGAVVLQQQATGSAELETRSVIDGQQRLTTLQLLLDAAQEVFETDGFAKEAKQLRRLVLNDEDFAMADSDHIFKLWPTLVDQEASAGLANELIVMGSKMGRSCRRTSSVKTVTVSFAQESRRGQRQTLNPAKPIRTAPVSSTLRVFLPRRRLLGTCRLWANEL